MAYLAFKAKTKTFQNQREEVEQNEFRESKNLNLLLSKIIKKEVFDISDTLDIMA